jgi:hypothetical protein
VKTIVSSHSYTGIRDIGGADHWKTARVLQSSENSLYTHIRKLALAPPQNLTGDESFLKYETLNFGTGNFYNTVPKFNQLINLWTLPSPLDEPCFLLRSLAASFIRLTASGIFDWRDRAV